MHCTLERPTELNEGEGARAMGAGVGRERLFVRQGSHMDETWLGDSPAGLRGGGSG